MRHVGRLHRHALDRAHSLRLLRCHDHCGRGRHRRRGDGALRLRARVDEEVGGGRHVDLPHLALAHLAVAAALVDELEDGRLLLHRRHHRVAPLERLWAGRRQLADRGEGVARPLLDLAEGEAVRRPRERVRRELRQIERRR